MHFRPNVMEGKYQICFNFMDSVLRKQSNVLNEINYFKLEMGLKHSFWLSVYKVPNETIKNPTQQYPFLRYKNVGNYKMLYQMVSGKNL